MKMLLTGGIAACVSASLGQEMALYSHQPLTEAPAPKPTESRQFPDTTTTRAIVHRVLADGSYIIVLADTAESYYRITSTTQYYDDHGRVISLDRIKSGTTATLYYTRTDEGACVSKVVVNDAPPQFQGFRVDG